MDQTPSLSTLNSIPPTPQQVDPPQPPTPQQPTQPYVSQNLQNQKSPINKPSLGFKFFAFLTIILTLLAIPLVPYALSITATGPLADIFFLRIPVVLVLIIIYIVLSIRKKLHRHIIISIVLLWVHILLTIITVMGLLAFYK